MPERFQGRVLRVVTRQSPLALAQTQWAAMAIAERYPTIPIEIMTVQSEGDRILDQPLAKIGGKGLFTKALEEHLLANTVDLAVHSLKDMPAELPEGLTLGAVLKRADHRDALLSATSATLATLPRGAVVGTSSLRRQAQLLRRRPDLQIRFLRGNVETRLKKLAQGEYDAIILAVAGLVRLGNLDYIGYLSQVLPPHIMLPAVGQGALGLECRADDTALQDLLKPLVDEETRCQVLAERSMNARLGGSCQTPIAGYAHYAGHTLVLDGLVASADGREVIRARARGTPTEYERLGVSVAERLLAQGARRLLQNC